MSVPLSNQRYVGLDLIRGVIILAILIININYISTPSIIRYNPLAFGEFSWLDEWVWAFEYTFIKQRFMPILALMFGGGIYLFSQKFERQQLSSTLPFLKRSLALAFIGLCHAYLIWDGDILFAYALCGLLAYFARNLSNKWLIGVGCILIVAPLVPDVIEIISIWEEASETPAVWQPDAEKIATLVSAYDGSWLSLTPERIDTAIGRQTVDLAYFTLWRVTGLMLVGIALMRSGFLKGEGNYAPGLLISLLIGLPTSLLGTYFYIQSGYDYAFFDKILILCFWVGTLSLAYAYLCLLILWGRSTLLPTLQRALSCVGRMALTLYISQNLISAFIFYGWGLGLYAEVSRSGIMLITIGILLFQVVFAQLWLKHSSFGPLEFVWRWCYSSAKKRKPIFAEQT